MRFNTALALCLLLTSGSAATPVRAAPEEIQVYLDDKEDPGNVSVDLHNNDVLVGDKQASYAGERPPDPVYRLTPEFNFGLTETLEAGAYLLTSLPPNGDPVFDGAKLRLKYIAPHDATAGPFWGLNLELGRTRIADSPRPWNGELKGILGWRNRDWTLAGNLNGDAPLARHNDTATAELDCKMARRISGDTSIGLESYNELGPFRRLEPLDQGSKSLFAALDTVVGGHDLNLGVGRGLTRDADRWVVKAIVNFRL
jgi:hypothetical protein